MHEHARFGLAQRHPARRSSRRMATSSGSRPTGPKKLGDEKVGRLVLDGDVILPRRRLDDERAPQARRQRPGLGRGRARQATASSRATPRSTIEGVPVEEDRRGVPRRSRVRRRQRRAQGRRDRGQAARGVRLAVRRCATEWTGKKPVVDVLMRQGLTAMKLGSILAIYVLFWVLSFFLRRCRSASAPTRRMGTERDRRPGRQRAAPLQLRPRRAARDDRSRAVAVRPVLRQLCLWLDRRRGDRLDRSRPQQG